MKMRKIFAGMAASAIAMTAMSISAFAYEDGEAHLSINNADWAEFEKTEETAVITGDGQYTVSLTAAEPTGELAHFNALLVENGETKFGNEYIITVDKIVIHHCQQATNMVCMEM